MDLDALFGLDGLEGRGVSPPVPRGLGRLRGRTFRRPPAANPHVREAVLSHLLRNAHVLTLEEMADLLLDAGACVGLPRGEAWRDRG